MFDIKLLFQNYLWVFNFFVIILLTGLVHTLSHRLLTRMLNKVEQKEMIYLEATFRSLKTPLAIMIWLFGICMALTVLLSHFHFAEFQYILQLKKIGLLLAVSWTLIRFVHHAEDRYIRACVANSKEVDKTLIHALSQLGIIMVVIISMLIMMQLLGLPISGLLAFGGIGGAAVAFAAKDLLANFFGSLVIYLDKPFKVGDWIRSPDKQIEGMVELIGWRATRIRTFDKRPLYVPNGVFLTISVENPSRMKNRRINTVIGIRYEDADKMDQVTQQVKAMLLAHPDIDTRQTLIVNFVEFGASSLNFMVYAFTKTTNWVKFQAIQHDVFMKIVRIIAANKAQCAYATQTLYLQNKKVTQDAMMEH